MPQSSLSVTAGPCPWPLGCMPSWLTLPYLRPLWPGFLKVSVWFDLEYFLSVCAWLPKKIVNVFSAFCALWSDGVRVVYVVGAQRMPISCENPTGGAVGRTGRAKRQHWPFMEVIRKMNKAWNARPWQGWLRPHRMTRPGLWRAESYLHRTNGPRWLWAVKAAV